MTGRNGKLSRRILVLTNGHGEDYMACSILGELRSLAPGLEVDAWPLVGRGLAFRAMNVPVRGPGNLLPGCGLSMFSPRLLARDLAAGWIRVHVAQALAARKLRSRSRYALALAVGDLVPALASFLAGIPYLFLRCALSSHYRVPTNPGEIPFLRKTARLCFPRDETTARDLTARGVPVRYAGLPCMDGLTPSGESLGLPEDAWAVALFPGSRTDKEKNARFLLRAMEELTGFQLERPVWGLVAAVEGFQERALLALPGWKALPRSPGLWLAHSSGARAVAIKGRFADILARSRVVAGVPGTAAEQAMGLGRPLVAFPISPLFPRALVEKKMQLYGNAALMAQPRPASVAREVFGILSDPGKRASMGEIGPKRMGAPGASRKIAREILAALEECRG